MKRIDVSDSQVINQAVKVLQQGGLIVFPTETCYGLGADPTNPDAIAKLLEFKGARGNKAISIAVADQVMAQTYVHLNSIAQNVYQTLLPGPITVVSESLRQVDSRIEHERKTLGIRIPDYPFALDLIKAFKKPITATSANPSGIKPPYSYDDFIKYTSDKKQTLIDLFIDAGKLNNRPPSTIVDTTLNEPTVLRQGELILENPETYTSLSPEQTQSLAAQIISKYLDLLATQPLVIALQGDLGAGKTHFVKGIGQALGISDTINSPTYTVIHEFDYHLPKVAGTLYHIDTWRLHDAHELLDLGFHDLLKPGNIIAIEWVEKMSDLIPQLPVLWVSITTSDTVRTITTSFKH